MSHSLSISLSQSLYISVSISYLPNTSAVDVDVAGVVADIVALAATHNVAHVVVVATHDYVDVGAGVAAASCAIDFCICGSW